MALISLPCMPLRHFKSSCAESYRHQRRCFLVLSYVWAYFSRRKWIFKIIVYRKQFFWSLQILGKYDNRRMVACKKQFFVAGQGFFLCLRRIACSSVKRNRNLLFSVCSGSTVRDSSLSTLIFFSAGRHCGVASFSEMEDRIINTLNKYKNHRKGLKYTFHNPKEIFVVSIAYYMKSKRWNRRIRWGKQALSLRPYFVFVGLQLVMRFYHRYLKHLEQPFSVKPIYEYV